MPYRQILSTFSAAQLSCFTATDRVSLNVERLLFHAHIGRFWRIAAVETWHRCLQAVDLLGQRLNDCNVVKIARSVHGLRRQQSLQSRRPSSGTVLDWLQAFKYGASVTGRVETGHAAFFRWMSEPRQKASLQLEG